MSRGTVAGLGVSRPILRQLPAIYQDHLFLEQFTAGLDDVTASAHAVLDCLHAYIDPSVAPGDFVQWLGDWVGLQLDEDWSLERRRRIVAAAVEMFAKRGTVAGLRHEIQLYTDGTATIEDPGGTFTSSVPGATFDHVTHHRDRTLRVTVDVADGASVNWNGLQELIRNAIPAHLPVEVELREVGGNDHRPPDRDEGDAGDAGDDPDPDRDPMHDLNDDANSTAERSPT
jgi:phage tail-like protein